MSAGIRRDKKEDALREDLESLTVVKHPSVTTSTILETIPKKHFCVIRSIRRFRERCHTKHNFLRLEKTTNDFYREARANSNHQFACYLLFEKLSTANYMKDGQKAIKRYGELVSYSNRHLIHERVLQLDIFTASLYMNVFKRDFESCISTLTRIYEVLSIRRSSIDVQLLHYPIGIFLISLLKLDLFESGPLLVTTVHKLRPLLMFYYNTCKSQSLQSVVSCINWIRRVTYSVFGAARQGTLIHQSEANFSWYQDPLDRVYPLLNMAKVKLDFPEFSAGQNRRLVTMEDITLARSCILTVNNELPGISNSNSVRFQARLKITKAGYYYRLHEADKEPNVQMALPTDAEDSVTAFTNLQRAAYFAQTAIHLVENTSFEELSISRNFHNFLSKYNDALQMRNARSRNKSLLEYPGNGVDIVEESSSGSEQDSRTFNEQMYLKDLSGQSSFEQESNESDM